MVVYNERASNVGPKEALTLWKVVEKRVKGTAKLVDPFGPIAPKLPPGIRNPVMVELDEPIWDMKTGHNVSYKVYETTEDAIKELGAKVVEQVQKDGQTVKGVRVSIRVHAWEDDK